MSLPTNNRWKNFRPSNMRNRSRRRKQPYQTPRYPYVDKKVVKKQVVPNVGNEAQFPSLCTESKTNKITSVQRNYAHTAKVGAECPDPPAHIRQLPERMPIVSKEFVEEIDYDDPDYTEYVDRVYLSEEEEEEAYDLSAPPTPKQIPMYKQSRGFTPPQAPPLVQTMSKKHDKSFQIIYNELDR